MFWALLVLGISAYMSIGYALGKAQKKAANEWEERRGKISPLKKYLFFPVNAFTNTRVLTSGLEEPILHRNNDPWPLLTFLWPFKFFLYTPLINLFGWSICGTKTPVALFAKYCLYYPFVYATYLLFTSPARILRIPGVVKKYLEKRKEKKALKAKEKNQKLLTETKNKAEKENYYTLRQSIAELEAELADRRRLLAQAENELAKRELVSVSPSSRDADLGLLAE